MANRTQESVNPIGCLLGLMLIFSFGLFIVGTIINW